MNPTPQRADPLSSFANEEPLELSSDQMIPVEPSFDQQQWTESQTEARGAGGRQVLGTSLDRHCRAVARLYGLVGRPRAGGAAAVVAGDRAMARGRRRPARVCWASPG